jgi:hypothetical protein
VAAATPVRNTSTNFLIETAGPSLGSGASHWIRKNFADPELTSRFIMASAIGSAAPRMQAWRAKRTAAQYPSDTFRLEVMRMPRSFQRDNVEVIDFNIAFRSRERNGGV